MTRTALKARVAALETQARMIGRRPPALVIVDQGKVTIPDLHHGDFGSLGAALAWLDTLGEPAAPDVVLSIVWPGDPIPPDCAEHWALHWPEDLQNSGAGASCPPGIPKPY